MQKAIKHIGLAFLAVLVGVLVRRYMLSGLEGRIVWVTFYPAVVVASVLGGWIPGILTALGSCLVATYGWFLLHDKAFINDSADWLGVYAFMFNCVLISWVAQLSHWSRIKAEMAQRTAEENSKAKSQFLANMSHEIRTPMNAVLGFANLLIKDPSLSPKSRDHVQVILNSGQHLLGLINDVLDMSRIESGKMEAHLEVFDFRTLIHDMETLFKGKAIESGLKFTVVADPNLPRFIQTDLGKLRQILINLLGNAFKFTKQGSVTLSAKYSEECFIIEVQDTGIGIADEDQARLFTPFERAKIGEYVAGGTGLGLALCKEYAHFIQGAISFESQVGMGSKFCLSFKATVTTNDTVSDKINDRAITLKPNSTNNRILIVDDQPENRRLLVEILTPLGFETLEAVDGIDALQKSKEFQPHIILLDFLMPKMNGAETAKALREMDQNKGLVILGISASAYEEDRNSFLASGCNAFLPKPFMMHDLFQTIAKHAHVEFEEAPIDSVNAQFDTHFDLNGLPQLWQQELKHALQLGNISQISTLANQICISHTQLSNWMLQKARNYDLDALKTLLHEVST